jgi:DNA-binding MarR family transcriptional regulator
VQAAELAADPAGQRMRQLTGEDYQNLLAFRAGLRRFLHWSQTQARAAGLTPAQHQLLLAIKGHRGQDGPAIGELASYLLLRPHSTAELVTRAEAAGLVERHYDHGDGRLTRVRLTADGEKRLDQLTSAHLREIQQLAPILDHLAAVDQPPGPAQGHWTSPPPLTTGERHLKQGHWDAEVRGDRLVDHLDGFCWRPVSRHRSAFRRLALAATK